MDFNELMLWCLESEIEIRFRQYEMHDCLFYEFEFSFRDRHKMIMERTMDNLMYHTESSLPYIFLELKMPHAQRILNE